MAPKSKKQKAVVVVREGAIPVEDGLTSSENRKWFNEKKSVKLIVERDIEHKLDTELGVSAILRKRDWQKILKLPKVYYSDLVRQFYANMENKDDPVLEEIVSSVRGVRITLNASKINTLLGIPDGGSEFDIQLSRCKGEKYTNYDCVVDFDVAPEPTGSDGTLQVLVKRFEVRERVLFHFLHHNVLPTASGYNVVRKKDIYVFKWLHEISGPERINFGRIVLQNMKQVVRYPGRGIAHPRLLTLVFKDFGVQVADLVAETVSADEILAEQKMGKLQYKLVDGKWVYHENGKPLYPGNYRKKKGVPGGNTSSAGVTAVPSSVSAADGTPSVSGPNEEWMKRMEDTNTLILARMDSIAESQSNMAVRIENIERTVSKIYEMHSSVNTEKMDM